MDKSSLFYKKLDFKCDYLLNLLQKNRLGFYFNSSLNSSDLGRYSFFGIEPFLVLQSKDGLITQSSKEGKKAYKGNAFQELRSTLDKYKLAVDSKKSSLPFLGGAVGFLSYDLGFCLENISRKNVDDLGVPDLWFAFFDLVLCVDHRKNTVLIFSSGFPETNPRLRKIQADLKLKNFLKNLSLVMKTDKCFYSENNSANEYAVSSNFTYDDYHRAVKKSLDYIIKGDIYQINLSQRFHALSKLSSEQLFLNLKRCFPVPFGGILKTDDFSIISGSPERFIKYDGKYIVTRPMKGTRPRSISRILDRKFRKELVNSKKDKAELLMIVDLERNDLGKVCDYGSVEVESLRNFEEYSTVFQTTAQIRGRLYPEMDRIDIIKACFPGGSITGCPKIRAMQIIEELEPNRRGIYTGGLGYLSFNGNMDFNILIRSFFKKNKDIYFGVGGGIVYDSTPEKEYEEIQVKAEVLNRALK
jgi:para-aminobenzoate synthetase component 1